MGETPRDLTLDDAEALALSLAGGAAGIAVGMLTVQLIVEFIPALPVQLAWGYLAAAFVLSLAIGMAAGVMPAIGDQGRPFESAGSLAD